MSDLGTSTTRESNQRGGLLGRFTPALVSATVVLCIWTILRVALAWSFRGANGLRLADVPLLFSSGLLADVLALAWIYTGTVLYLALVPERVLRWKLHSVAWWTLSVCLFGVVIFGAFAEWFFWEEFGSRFNFIAVDYLVYTTEALGNIQESYPLTTVLGIVAGSAVVIASLLRRPLTAFGAGPSTGRLRWIAVASVLSLDIVSFQVPQSAFSASHDNRYGRELARNGMHSLVDAFRRNELDYETYYTANDESAALADLRTVVSEDGGEFLSMDLLDMTRVRHPREDLRRANVVLIVVESLSAEFLGSFGSTEGLTPHLDELVKESLLFDNMYATGCRTVRGLEALTLSVPPTPGRSIVKRPMNEAMSTCGWVFAENGYQTKFVYGGYGYFDNMNAYFAGNGFEVVDRTDMPKEEVRFSNIWGVSDGDLFRRVLEECDRSSAASDPFFTLALTTSNHRPYTYPDEIDIPPGTGRSGAVKYTDHAIGEFFGQARDRDWFSDTVFVVIADHCASSAGRREIALSKYRIPLLMYAPGFIEPGVVSVLGSQIDVIPTLLGILGHGYTHRFFGRDLLNDEGPGRALVANYQTLGLYEGETLTLLLPNFENKAYRVDPHGLLTPTAVNAEELTRAVALYQGASILYRRGGLGQPAPANQL